MSSKRYAESNDEKALFKAAKEKDYAILSSLLKKGVSPNVHYKVWKHLSEWWERERERENEKEREREKVWSIFFSQFYHSFQDLVCFLSIVLWMRWHINAGVCVWYGDVSKVCFSFISHIFFRMRYILFISGLRCTVMMRHLESVSVFVWERGIEWFLLYFPPLFVCVREGCWFLLSFSLSSLLYMFV